MSFRKVAAPRRAGVSDCARRNRSRPQRSTREVVLEFLEDRTLLSATPEIHPTYIIYHPNNGVGPYQTAAPNGYTPAQIRAAYGYDAVSIDGITGDGAGQTIAIVDAYDYPTARTDLAAFDQQFNLPAPPSFQILNQQGQSSPLPPTDPAGPGDDWEGEEALDIEWAHAAAPLANLILVEADSPATLLPYAVQTAASLPGVSVVSMSFGSPEAAGELSLDSTFTTPAGHIPVTFLAATGDSGSPGGYPAYSPNVVAVGGTSLTLNPDNSYASESGWSDGGGGTSQYEPQPSYQAGLSYPGRSIPDVSIDADPETGVAVYDTYDNGTSTPWVQVGGTSLACPLWAGIIATVDQERVAVGAGILDGATQTLPMLYSLPSTDFHDITTGNNGLPAGPGYDQVTGIGSPIVPSIVQGMLPQIAVTPFSPSTLSLAEEGNPVLDASGNSVIQVAQFKDLSGNLPPADYIAAVNWGDGTAVTDGSIVDLGTGYYGVYASHTYAEEGTYTFTVTVVSPTGESGSANTSITVVDAPLTPIPTTIDAVEGARFSGIVGSFDDANPNAPLTDYTVTINWGDGESSSANITQPGGTGTTFDVSGVHTYVKYGTYQISIEVDDVGGSTTEIDSTADVADAAISPVPTTITEVVGAQFNNVVVGSFLDADSAAPKSGFSVSVDWGDGSVPNTLANGVSLLYRGNEWNVLASHVYQHYGTGSYPITITVNDAGGSSTTVDSQANLVDAGLTMTGSTFVVQQGQTFTGAVATFVSTNVYADVSDYNTPSIDWGDGSPLDVGTIEQLGPGEFEIIGTHTYTTVGTPTVTVNVTSVGGSTASATTTETVEDAPIQLTALAQSGVAGAPITPVVAQPVLYTVAYFTDGYSQASLGDFSATVTWGDQTSSPATIVQPGGLGTTFYVVAEHEYERPQVNYPISVTVNDVGGATATQSVLADVSDAPFTVNAATLQSIVEGGVVTGAVGTLSTPNLLAQPADYVASINWGDGTITGGLITPNNVTNGIQTFTITSATPHGFDADGTYPIKLTVVSVGGTNENVSEDVDVADAPISGVASSPITAIAGTTFNGVVGSFTQYSGTSPSDFTATINWGDGVSEPATVAAGTNGMFTVSATHEFADPGSRSATITVSDTAGSTGSFTIGVSVSDVPLSVSASNVAAVQGVAFTGQVATFTQANTFATPGQYAATINWGDGTTTKGSISGGNGVFTVTGNHTFGKGVSGGLFTVTVAHVISGATYSSGSATASVNVIGQLTGALRLASDNGVSDEDGVTSITSPTFNGTAQPLSTITIYAAPTSNPTATTQVGSGTTNASGNWVITIGPLGQGSYVITASMTNPTTGDVVMTRRLATGDAGGPLVIATSGPTVSDVLLNPALGQMSIIFQTGVGSISLASIANKANYQLAVPSGNGLAPLTPTGLIYAKGANNTYDVVLSYGHKLSAGTYVVTLNSPGLTDLAGNMLIETRLVAYPQQTNSPNPDYIAQIIVTSTGATSAPSVYISAADIKAAQAYAKYLQTHTVVRVPTVVKVAAIPQGPVRKK